MYLLFLFLIDIDLQIDMNKGGGERGHIDIEWNLFFKCVINDKRGRKEGV